ncbi:MAG: glucose 1-dehydrogenase [Oligoflexia bacterium]|nr:glucose 1-dehydrogenase [Oligoflexia bacterium]
MSEKQAVKQLSSAPRALEGKVALVTGATGGIGRACAIALARQGASVVVSGRREREGQETVSLVLAQGVEAVFISADISSEVEVERMVARTVERFGKIDIAVNNAAAEGRVALMADQQREEVEHLFDVNITGTWLSLKYELAAMLRSGGGSIVNVVSIHGFGAVVPGLSIYTASKHAIVGLTKAAALDYAQSGIRVNAVAPGPTRTEMLERAGGGNVESFAELLPMKRLGMADEIAEAVAWLASPASSFVNGHVIAADGGYLAQ